MCNASLITKDSLMYLVRFLFHSLAPKRVVSFSSPVYFPNVPSKVPVPFPSTKKGCQLLIISIFP